MPERRKTVYIISEGKFDPVGIQRIIQDTPKNRVALEENFENILYTTNDPEEIKEIGKENEERLKRFRNLAVDTQAIQSQTS